MIEYIGINLGVIVFIYYFINIFNISTIEKKRLHKLMIVSYILIVILGTITYKYKNEKYKKKHHRDLTFFEFINGGPIDSTFFERVLKGLGVGIVFGIIDNGGLWFGMDALDPILPKGTLTRAGFGNVFSDTLSAFLSTFAGAIIAHHFPVGGETPIWTDAIGTFVGTLIGLFGSRTLTGRT
jgi:hypothetical protein